MLDSSRHGEVLLDLGWAAAVLRTILVPTEPHVIPESHEVPHSGQLLICELLGGTSEAQRPGQEAQPSLCPSQAVGIAPGPQRLVYW